MLKNQAGVEPYNTSSWRLFVSVTLTSERTKLSSSRIRHSPAAETAGFLFLSTIMIATISNSWSELLSLRCVTHSAGESNGDCSALDLSPNEHFCTELPELLCHCDL